MKSLNKKIILLIWGASAFTKGIYAYIGLRNNLENSSEVTSEIAGLFIFGLTTTVVGAILSFIIHRDKNMYKNKWLIGMYRRQSVRTGWKIEDIMYFNLLTVSIGLTETTALIGLVGYVVYHNIQYFATTLVISLIGWVLTFPRYEKYEAIRKSLM